MTTTGFYSRLYVRIIAVLFFELGCVLSALVFGRLDGTLKVWPGSGLGLFLGVGIRKGFAAVPEVWRYLRVMGPPLLGYALGYAFIVMWFASMYAALDTQSNHTAFMTRGSIASPERWILLSLTTFPPVGGYDGVLAKSNGAWFFITTESIIGVGYTTVVFAAIIVYLTPKFDRVSKEKSGEKEFEKESEP